MSDTNTPKIDLNPFLYRVPHIDRELASLDLYSEIVEKAIKKVAELNNQTVTERLVVRQHEEIKELQLKLAKQKVMYEDSALKLHLSIQDKMKKIEALQENEQIIREEIRKQGDDLVTARLAVGKGIGLITELRLENQSLRESMNEAWDVVYKSDFLNKEEVMMLLEWDAE